VEDVRAKHIAIWLAIGLTLPSMTKAQAIAPITRPSHFILAAPDGPVEPPVRDYAVTQRQDTAPPHHDGWSLFATTNGRSMDPRAGIAWADDPGARLGEIDAGLGWRRRDLAIVIGYTQPDFGARKDPLDQAGPSALVGFSLALRTR
jgi:hypothetical protein